MYMHACIYSTYTSCMLNEHTFFKDILMSYPAMMEVPDVIRISPVSMLKVVVFPAPLTPSKPKHSPLGMPRLIPETAFLAGRIVQPERWGL